MKTVHPAWADAIPSVIFFENAASPSRAGRGKGRLWGAGKASPGNGRGFCVGLCGVSGVRTAYSYFDQLGAAVMAVQISVGLTV